MFKKKIILTSIIFLATLSCSSETTTPAKIIQPDNQIDLQQSSNQALDTTQNDNTKNTKIIKNEDKKSTPASDSIINNTKSIQKTPSQKQSDNKVKPITMLDFDPEIYSRECIVDTLDPKSTYEIYQSNKINQDYVQKIDQCLVNTKNKNTNVTKNDFVKSDTDKKPELVEIKTNNYSKNCLIDTLGQKDTDEIYKTSKIKSDILNRITQCVSNSSDNDSKPKSNNQSKQIELKESIEQLIQRLYIPKVNISEKKLIKDTDKCDEINPSKMLHNNMEFNWQSIPLISGEVADFNVSKTDPNVIYLGVQENSHSIYKSIDGGKNWNRIHYFDHTKSMDIHPSNPDIFIYGDTQQIWLTEDGKNFNKSFQSKYPPGPHRTSYSSIVFSPSNPSIVLASIRGRSREAGGELYVSNNGGKSFDQLNINLPNITVLLFDSINSEIVYFGADDGIYVTKDFFKSYAKILNANSPTSIVRSKDRKIIVGSVDGIHISYDSGETWTKGEGIDNTIFLRIKEIHSDPNTVWATTSKGIAISKNGGKNWELNHPDNLPINVKALEVFSNDPNKIIVATDTFQFDVRMDAMYRQGLYDNQGIYISNDGGKSWSMSSDGIHANEIETIETSPTDPSEVWAAQQASRGFYKSNDSGEKWKLFSSWLSHYPMQIKYIPGYSNALVASSSMYYSSMGFSYDGGNTWNLLTAKTFLDLAISCVNSTKDTFTNLIISKTREEGAPKGSIHLHGLAINPNNPDEIYVGSVSDSSVWTDAALRGIHLFKTMDGGITWLNIGKGLPFNSESSIRDIQISQSNPQILYLGLSHLEAVSGNGIWKSLDGGENWIRSNDGMPNDTSVHSLHIHSKDSNLVIAGTETGLYKTKNGGKSWTKTLTNKIKDIDYLKSDPNVVYIIGNRGAWVSSDFGDNWNVITNDSIHKNRPEGNISDNFYNEYIKGSKSEYNPSPIRGSSISVNCNGSTVYIGLNHYGIFKTK